MAKHFVIQQKEWDNCSPTQLPITPFSEWVRKHLYLWRSIILASGVITGYPLNTWMSLLDWCMTSSWHHVTAVGNITQDHQTRTSLSIDWREVRGHWTTREGSRKTFTSNTRDHLWTGTGVTTEKTEMWLKALENKLSEWRRFCQTFLFFFYGAQQFVLCLPLCCQ